MSEMPALTEWIEAARETVPVFGRDRELMQLLMERFRNKYLRAAMAARNEAAEERAWDGFFYWLVAGATARKPFSATDAQADALIIRFRALAERVKDVSRGTVDRPPGE